MAQTVTAGHQSEERKKSIKTIWKVFWILAIITAVEVLLGIFRPDFLDHHRLWSMKLLNWVFVGLTVVKAYYITWTFMHMEHETASLRRSVVWTVVFYISYIVFIFLVEGDYLYEVMHNDFMIWDF